MSRSQGWRCLPDADLNGPRSDSPRGWSILAGTVDGQGTEVDRDPFGLGITCADPAVPLQDRGQVAAQCRELSGRDLHQVVRQTDLLAPVGGPPVLGCLLYTSDAADEEDSVDLGG